MKRFVAILVICAGVAFQGVANGQDTPESSTPQAQAGQSLADQLKAKPDDRALFNKYMIENLNEIRTLMNSDADKSETKLGEMRKVIESLEPETDAGKQLVGQAIRAVEYYGQQIALARVTLDELVKKLEADPGDEKSIGLYQAKLMTEIMPLTRSEPDKAEKLLTDAKKLLAKIKEGAEEDAVKTAIDRIERSFSGVEKQIETGKRLAALVGTEAAPLAVEAWVNGEPLTDADLKGKVVLLDFWAVWCGPCVATFPHLIEWHEKYADKGLIVIGLTRYYQFTWNDEAGRASRAPAGEEVAPEQEQEMLARFAEHHNLHHRFGIQTDSSMSDYYAVTGIPHVVLIDRQGKIRLFRIGSGPENAKDISEMLEKLITKG